MQLNQNQHFSFNIISFTNITRWHRAGDAVGGTGAGDAVGGTGAGDAVGGTGAGDAVGGTGAGGKEDFRAFISFLSSLIANFSFAWNFVA